MQTQADPSDPLVFECDFDEPPETVWRALTEPQLLEEWLTAGDFPPSAPGPNDSTSSEYEVLAAEPHRLLRYRWRDREGGSEDLERSDLQEAREVQSVVTFELAPGPLGGTHLRLTHGDFRIVSAAAPTISANVTSITSARRLRTPDPIVSCAMPWRRAA